MNEKQTHCPLCTLESAVFTGSVHNDPSTNKEYSLYECKSCFAQFWSPLENPGGVWYEHDERYKDRNNDPITEPNRNHLRALAFFKDKQGTVLDVGCGTGNFLRYAEHKGWTGWGIDFDRDAISAAQNALHLERASVSDLQTFAKEHPDLRFDLVSFFDVFEHVDNHNEFLSLVKSILVPGGHIVLSVPYRHAWRWLIPADVPPRHLTRWDEKSLTHILNRHGFTVRQTTLWPATLYFIVLKLRFKYGKWASFGLVKKAREAAGVSSANDALQASKKTSIRLVSRLAKTKDIVLFGIPALIIWLVLLPTKKRYTDIHVIAQQAS